MKPRIPKTIALSLINDETGEVIKSIPLKIQWDQATPQELERLHGVDVADEVAKIAAQYCQQDMDLYEAFKELLSGVATRTG